MAVSSLTCSLPFPLLIRSPSPTRIPTRSKFLNPNPLPCSANAVRTGVIRNLADGQRMSDASMSIDNLRQFFDLNVGRWTGSFHQFDVTGNLLHKIDTRLSVSSYGEDEFISLIQSLYIKQPPSTTSFAGDDEEPEWAEYKIKETNMFTVDKYQQLGFFPDKRAFSLRYQTAGMLEAVLRRGVLGEDDTEEESPRDLKLPSQWPSVVCENCLYSELMDRRARAFHIMNPKGILEMLLVFLEDRGEQIVAHPVLDNFEDNAGRITPFLGKWKGHSVTKRSGVYGATITEAETFALLECDDKGRLVQDISSTSKEREITTNVHWSGTKSFNVVTFEEGYQMTLLPGGMYMGCPCDIAKSIAESKSFNLEFCWLESLGTRQRLVRTYDMEGLVVSSTYFYEIKL